MVERQKKKRRQRYILMDSRRVASDTRRKEKKNRHLKANEGGRTRTECVQSLLWHFSSSSSSFSCPWIDDRCLDTLVSNLSLITAIVFVSSSRAKNAVAMISKTIQAIVCLNIVTIKLAIAEPAQLNEIMSIQQVEEVVVVFRTYGACQTTSLTPSHILLSISFYFLFFFVPVLVFVFIQIFFLFSFLFLTAHVH